MNGLEYLFGLGVQKNFVKARDFFEMAALQNNMYAQNHLGFMYKRGKVEGFRKGSLQANAAAVQWYQRAADQGFAPAQNILGMMYYDGEVEGFPENSRQANAAAADWLQRAADQGIDFLHNQKI